MKKLTIYLLFQFVLINLIAGSIEEIKVFHIDDSKVNTSPVPIEYDPLPNSLNQYSNIEYIIKLFYGKENLTDIEGGNNWTLNVNYTLHTPNNVPKTGTLSIGRYASLDKLIDFTLFANPLNGNAKLVINSITSTNGPIPNDIHLEFIRKVNLNIQNNFIYSSSDIEGSVNPLVIGSPLDIYWQFAPGLETYEFEWVFIDKEDVNSATITSSNVFDHFNPNNSDYTPKVHYKEPINILTSNNYFDIDLIFPEGNIYYRVRGVSTFEDETKAPFYGDWSPVKKFNISLTEAFEKEKTWQTSTVYSEDGKNKTAITYFDGGNRSRQSIVELNEDKNKLVSEAIYDYEGRSSLNILPAIVSENSLNYLSQLNQNQSNQSYSKKDFDRAFDDIGNPISSAPLSLSENSGAALYFSPNNNIKSINKDYIPDADGYVFSQVEYLRDGTGRAKSISGIGKDFDIYGDRATNIFYGGTNNTELKRLFGSNVGDAIHYKKNYVLDPNGQVSASYLDKYGRTIATALVGLAPDNLLALGKDVPEIFDTEINSILDNQTLESVAYQNIVNTLPNSLYSFTYNLIGAINNINATLPNYNPNLPDDNISICATCEYELEIIVKNSDGDLLPLVSSLGGATFSGSNDSQSNITDISLDRKITKTFNAGTLDTDFYCGDLSFTDGIISFSLNLSTVDNFKVIKTLKIKDSSLELLIDKFETSTAFNNLESAINTSFASDIDYEMCAFTCEQTCLEVLINDYMINNATTRVAAVAYFTPIQELIHDYMDVNNASHGEAVTFYTTTYSELNGYSNCMNTCLDEALDLTISLVEENECENNLDRMKKQIQEGGYYFGNVAWWNDVENILEYIYYFHENNTSLTVTEKQSLYSFKVYSEFLSNQAIWDRYNVSKGINNIDLLITKIKQTANLPIQDDLIEYLVMLHPEYCHYEACVKNIKSSIFDDHLYVTNDLQDARDFTQITYPDGQVSTKFADGTNNHNFTSTNNLIYLPNQDPYFQNLPLGSPISITNYRDNWLLDYRDIHLAGSSPITYNIWNFYDPTNIIFDPASPLANTGITNPFYQGIATGSQEEFDKHWSLYKSAYAGAKMEYMNFIQNTYQTTFNFGVPNFSTSGLTPPLWINDPQYITTAGCPFIDANYAIFVDPIPTNIYDNDDQDELETLNSNLSQINSSICSGNIASWKYMLTSSCLGINDAFFDNNLSALLEQYCIENVGLGNPNGGIFHSDFMAAIASYSTNGNCSGIDPILCSILGVLTPTQISNLSCIDALTLDDSNYELVYEADGITPITVTSYAVNPCVLSFFQDVNDYVLFDNTFDPVNNSFYSGANIAGGYYYTTVGQQSTANCFNLNTIYDDKYSCLSTQVNGVDFFLYGNDPDLYNNSSSGSGYDTKLKIWDYINNDYLEVGIENFVQSGALYERLFYFRLIDFNGNIIPFHQLASLNNIHVSSNSGNNYGTGPSTPISVGVYEPGLAATALLTTGQSVQVFIEFISLTDCVPGYGPDYWYTSKTTNVKIPVTTVIYPGLDDLQLECWNQLELQAAWFADSELNHLLDDVYSLFYNETVSNCLNITEEFKMSYKLQEHHYTLYYYDQAGNLTQTIPPEGVFPLKAENFDATTGAWNGVEPDHSMETQYRYNTLGQLLWSQNPDGGAAKFWYNNATQLVASQNDEQVDDIGTQDKISYSKYDAFGRLKEVGEAHLQTPQTYTGIETAITNSNTFLEDLTASATTPKTQRIVTYFGDEDTYSPEPWQQNLKGRVAMVENTNTNNVLVSTIKYSYDIHGNLLKQVEYLADANESKSIDYEFNIFSGLVNKLYYQKGQPDQYIHKYEYDADNRLRNVYTSRDNVIWDEEAEYFYYAHGSLARIEIGDEKVQGRDYYYTLQGWLKGINTPNNTNTKDPGKDGEIVANNFNKYNGVDEYALALGYFEDDYKPITSAVNLGAAQNPWASFSSQLMPAAHGDNKLGLYNGNIAWQMSNIAPNAIDNALGGHPFELTKNGNVEFGSLQTMVYEYDQLNRIKQSRSFSGFDGTNWARFAGDNYDTDYNYDANGNITYIKRSAPGVKNANGNFLPTGVFDEINFDYSKNSTTNLNSKNPLINNMLNRVTESNPGSSDSKLNTDIDNQTNAQNYTYNDLGSLKSDASEEIAKISYTITGKVASVERIPTSSKMDIEYIYNPMGHRVAQIMKEKVLIAGTANYEVKPSNTWKKTYYSATAGGDVLAMFNLDPSDAGPNSIDYSIYGSGRLGTNSFDEIDLNDLTIIGSGEDPKPFNILIKEGEVINYIFDKKPLQALTEGDIIIWNGFALVIEEGLDCTYGVGCTYIVHYLEGYYEVSSNLFRGRKKYELNNHLGNVMVVVSDKRKGIKGGTGYVSQYFANVVSAQDYYPFGWTMPGREFKSYEYKYGFNGMEKDNTAPQGTEGANYTTPFRMLDTRLGGRWWSIDPIVKPWESSYAGFSNNPIYFSDPSGLDPGDEATKEDIEKEAGEDKELLDGETDYRGGNPCYWCGNNGETTWGLPNEPAQPSSDGCDDVCTESNSDPKKGNRSSILSFLRNLESKLPNLMGNYEPNSGVHIWGPPGQSGSSEMQKLREGGKLIGFMDNEVFEAIAILASVSERQDFQMNKKGYIGVKPGVKTWNKFQQKLKSANNGKGLTSKEASKKYEEFKRFIDQTNAEEFTGILESMFNASVDLSKQLQQAQQEGMNNSKGVVTPDGVINHLDRIFHDTTRQTVMYGIGFEVIDIEVITKDGKEFVRKDTLNY